MLSFIKLFKRKYYLVGGTAIALHIGHRESIDFDLFTLGKVDKKKILEAIESLKYKSLKIFEGHDQYHAVVNDVKCTFFQYPYNIPHIISVENHITIPSLLDLAAMKALAMAQRSKWKDYVDLYFIIKNHYSIKEISEQAYKYFEGQFSEKLFRGQLQYFTNINYSEQIDYLIPNPPSEQEVKDFLTEKALDIF